MKRSLKQIFKYKNCIGLLMKDKKENGFVYLPTNDLGLFYEIMNLPSEEVDKVEIITKINILDKYYIIYIEEENTSWGKDFETLEEAIKSIIEREQER